ncbi:hypothetical protein Cni_G22794 [Canna indica]|uniref:MAPK kinase substrate protein n=1 Tax=Canna indica TaxID=4628 RepID=A0AAQ3KT06_9LILI|nr:hypothetical protein Cni_G22794 [Canna indica]
MAGLQRSATTFRRSGSSGLVWDERLFSGDLNQMKKEEEAVDQVSELRHCKSVGSAAAATMGCSRGSTAAGRRAFRAGDVSPDVDPPSPKATRCLCCGAFGKPISAKRPKPRRH